MIDLQSKKATGRQPVLAFCLAAFILFAGCGSLVAQAGKTGLAFLKLGVSARGVALGESIIAARNGADAVYWNPAGLVDAKSEVVFSHAALIQDTELDFLAARFRFLNGAAGVFVQLHNIGGIEQRSLPTTEPTAVFDAHDVAIGFAYARRLNPELRFGITAKFLTERIVQHTSTGGAFDVGLSWQPKSMPDLSVAATLQHLGSMSKVINESIKLPTTGRLGAAWTGLRLHQNVQTSVFAAGSKIFAAGGQFSAGLEAVANRKFSTWLGWLTGREARSITAGAGLQASWFRLAYAYVPFSDDLGDQHMFTLYLSR